MIVSHYIFKVLAVMVPLTAVIHCHPVANSSGHTIRISLPTPNARAHCREVSILGHTIRQKCKPEGFDFLNRLSSFKCKTLQDLAVKGVSTASSGLSSLSEQDLNDNQLNDIQISFISKMVEGINEMLLHLSRSDLELKPLLSSNVCLGNFRKTEIFEDIEGVCENLPLRGEWSVFGFALDIGVGSPFNAACPTERGPLGTHVSFCIAINVDTCTKIPSFVLSVTPKLFKCAPFSQILAASSAGASIAVIEAVDIVTESVTWGISLTNSFEEEVKLFNGDKVIPDFTHRGTFYSTGDFALDATRIGIPPFFSFRGKAVKMLGVDGKVVQAKSVLTQLTKSPKSSAEALMKSLTSLKLSIFYKMDLTMAFAFSKLKSRKKDGKAKNSLKMALPDSGSFTIGTASVFANTYPVVSKKHTPDRLVPGMYMYSSASPVSTIADILKYVLKFVGPIMEFLPNWAPANLNSPSSRLLTLLDPSGQSSGGFAIAMAIEAANTKAVLFFKFPLLLDILGFIEIKCMIDIDNEWFKCSVRSKFGKDIFGAVGDSIEDGILFIARKIDDFADDPGDTRKEIIAAGLSTLGDAAGKFGSAFSEATTKSTAEALQAGKLTLSKLGDVKYKVQAWAAKSGGKFDDILADVGSSIEVSIKDIGKRGEETIVKIEGIYKDALSTFKPLLGSIESAFDCTTDAVISAMNGEGTQCPGLKQLTSNFKRAGGNFKKAFDKVEEAFEDIEREIQNTFKEAGTFLGFGNQRRERVLVKNSVTSRKDRNTGCKLIAFFKEIVTESRKCFIICGKWKQSSTRNEIIGMKPMASCVMDILKKVDKALGQATDVEKLNEKSNKAARLMKACSAAERSSIASLRGHGLKCSTVFQTEKGKIGTVRVFHRNEKWRKNGFRGCVLQNTKGFKVPTTVICTVPRISPSGGFSSRITVRKSADVPFLETGIDQYSFSALERSVQNEIVSKISGSCNPTKYL